MPTAQQCIDRSKWQADLENGGRVVAATVLPFVNLAYREAWDLFIAHGFEDKFVKLHAATFTMAGGSSGNTFALSAATDLYKVKGVQYQTGDRWSDPLPTFEFNEMQDPPDGLSYCQLGDTLYFEPNESLAGYTFRLWYVYKPTDLALGDSITDVNGQIEQYIIDTLGARVSLREEDADTGALLGLRKALEERVVLMAAALNAGKGKRIAITRRSRWRRHPNRTKTGIYLP